MPRVKISELGALGGTPASGDYFPIVDVSDTSESADGTTKRVLYSDLGVPTGTVDTSGTPAAGQFARFTDADTIEGRTAAQVRTDLNVEDGADVTDATNVDAAGAVMNSDTSTAAMSFVVDEDTMVSDSATKVPTQQSVKAYVDAAAGATGYYDIIDHGATASTARTGGLATDGSNPVLWRGTVEPTNAVNGDDWLDYT